jgi:hypothetical protein
MVGGFQTKRVLILQKFCDCTAASRHRIDLRSHLFVFDQWGGMMRLASCIDDKRAGATPVLSVREAPDTIDIGRWIASSERGP